MSKFLKLKEWLSIAEAAKHLSNLFGEEVSGADVFRLALDGRLILSIHLVQPVHAKPSEIMATDSELLVRYPGIGSTILSTTVDTLVSLDGVLDLPLVSEDRWYVEVAYRSLLGEDVSFSHGPHPGIVVKQGEQLFTLFEAYADGCFAMFDDESHSDQKKRFLMEGFCEMPRWPESANFVVRVSSLQKLDQSCNKTADISSRPTGTRERNTLLTIIAAICNYSDIDHKARGAAKQIEGFTDDIGAHVDEATILSHLKKIPTALEPRMK